MKKLKKLRRSLPYIGDSAADKKFVTAFKKAMRLLRHKYVTGVTTGYAVSNGMLTSKKAICIHVTKKKKNNKLLRSKRFPRSIGGIPVDVIESNFEAQVMGEEEVNARRNIPADPMQPGVAIQAAGEGLPLGTLGMFVVDTTTDILCVLTAAHVLAAPEKTVVYQPHSRDSKNKIGLVGRSCTKQDAAIAPIDPDIPKSSFNNIPMGGNNKEIREFRMACELKKNNILVKSGCMSGLTKAVVSRLGILQYEVNGSIQSVNGFHLEPVGGSMDMISLKGDSGSIWYDETTGQAIGLHVAGDKTNNTAMACHIINVFTDLKIDFPQ